MTEDGEVFVSAVYLQEGDAANAVRALLSAHFPSDKVGALMCQRETFRELGVTHKTGVGVGAGLGVVLGAVGGAVIAVSGLLLAGPAFLAIEGALAGGAFGSLAGTLGGLGFWKDEVDFPTDAFEKGAVLVGISTDGKRVELARATLLEAGAVQVQVSTKRQAAHAAGANVPPPTPGVTAALP